MTARRSLGARSGFSSFAFYGVLLTLAVGGPVACAGQAYAAGSTPPASNGSAPVPAAGATGPVGSAAVGGDSDNLPPYLMLRSLQFVQDSVVRGDHSAADMQRFLLTRIDKRLRTAAPSDFEDPRNVDAALIYTMSGGNPATLDYLVARDVDGHFDNRVSDMLRKYLSGKGVLVASSLGEMVPLYQNGRVGPYIALVAGNVTLVKDPAGALKFFDIARLVAPGTIVEEAALRRSFQIAMDTGQNGRAMAYANRYARRFLYSPYASQFADLLVQLVVDHFSELDKNDILATLATMDPDRQREVYLRIARRATINGNQALASLASSQAQSLAGLPDKNDPQALLYGGAALISTTDVKNALNTISQLPKDQLSASDNALLEAARAVAQEIITLPTAPQSPSASPSTPPPSGDNTAPESVANVSDQQDPGVPAKATAMPDAGSGTAPVTPASADAKQKPDPEFQTFMSGGRSKLEEIDKMLKGEGVTK
ncbi:chemotaxis protein [Agrobacterium vitis]|uniref:Chemotaxis protein n=2 Tax=Rhizobium/Agrobacterium group TaxID=227290 RepID=B9JRR0_ALLAM|nr:MULTISPECIES: chemotaxis protein MotC [Rhizobium/Agrobacterium group]ACM35536.1 Chemotaxis protein [Allorhizobium ampelinum S4]MCF1447956.1 chemotaxis protein [Allorhizobium ampelinum]MCF1464207.1 chemotaxis protein [Allorhizobium ampelinum]MCF1495517.1 chemotaxis protein [Allorhizobium ampelinum]MUO29529.1 chemotaxis protein [Agrobacterium vitis]